MRHWKQVKASSSLKHWDTTKSLLALLSFVQKHPQTTWKKKKKTNECGCVPIKLYLQTLITEFHLFSHITKHYSSFDVTVKKNEKNIISSCVWVLVSQYGPTLCDPMDHSRLGSFVHGILQARILKWVAIPFTSGSSRPRDQTWVSCSAGRFFTTWATSCSKTSCRLDLVPRL